MATDDYKSLRSLTERQLLAIDALLTGSTHREAAEAAGVHRVTVSGWVSTHPAFQAELNRRRQELNEGRAARLRELDEAALNALAARLDDGDPEYAMKWLKLRGLGNPVHGAVGSTDAESIIEDVVQARLTRDPLSDMLKELQLAPGQDPATVRKEVEADLLERLQQHPEAEQT